MIAREGCCYELWMTKFRNKFRRFSNAQENHPNDVQKSLEASAIAECMSFIENSLESSDEVTVMTNFFAIVLKTWKYS